MKLIGFGCSFTYGSELLNPELEQTWDQQIENIKYRENKVWLGVLAKRLGLEADNYSQPACSNYAIQEIFAEWFNKRDIQEPVTVVIGWTNHMRNSWWHEEHGWIHDGFIRNQGQELFKNSFKDWVNYSKKRNEIITNNAKLFVNSVCKSHNIPIIQLNALSNVTNPYQLSNCHQGDQNMHDVLLLEGKRLNKNFLADGGHPNESGHEHYVEMLYSWIKAKNIV